MPLHAKITGTGYALPERIVTNAELAAVFQTSDEWIQEKIGVCERRYVRDGQGASDLGVAAAQMALQSAGMHAANIDAIVMASSTADYAVPGAGVLVQDKLGCRTIPAYEIHNSSPGFLFAMEAATGLVHSGNYERVLVVASEVHSTGLDFSDRGRLMSVIFGDGAGAVVIEAKKMSHAAIHTRLYSDGKYFDKLWCEAPASLHHPRITHEMIDDGRIYPQMDGRFIFEQALLRMGEACRTLLASTKSTLADIDWIVPHQANLRIIQNLADTLSVPRERVITTIERTGNLSAASIPVALGTAIQDGRIKAGERLLCPSFGSGFSWGAMMIQL